MKARTVNVADLAIALRSDPDVFDCAVIAREARDGSLHKVAYVVPTGPVSTSRLLRMLADRFGPGGVPDALLQVPAIPLTPDGECDTEALCTLPVPDAGLLEEAERVVATELNAERVAAVAHLSVVAGAPLHLSDVVPKWTRSSILGSTPPAEPPLSSRPGAQGPLALSDGGELRFPEGSPTWLGETLLNSARSGAPAGMVFHDAEGAETFVTYADLLAGARRVLGGLQIAGLGPRDFVIFHFKRHRDFFEAFWACILGQMIPVPTPVASSYTDLNSNVRRLGDALGMLDGAVIATSAEQADDVRAALHLLELAKTRIVVLESLRESPPKAHPAPPARDEVALMMLTSGSTGRPKGVPLTHGNLLSRSFASCRRNGIHAGSVSLNWMPLDHVAGLIFVHLRDMWAASRQVHVETELVLRDPLLWIDLMDRHRATSTFAPNFAYGLVCAHAEDIARRSWDLSCVRRVLNGGEAIVAASARKFLLMLAPHGLADDTMVPAWGMSETSSGVTYCDNFRLHTVTDNDPHVSVGPPLEGVRLRIVDEAGELLREGEVGHLQVAGATLFPGYFGNIPPREEAFTADGWFRTGDLARLDRGELTITGRAKDVIIVNGSNFSGPAIENSVEEVPGVARSFTAACGVPDPRNDGAEGLAIFFVPEDHRDEALRDTLRAIHERIVHEFGVGPAFIVPLARDDIPKTSIGKIQRTALQKALATGQLESALKRVDLLIGNANTLPAWFFRRTWRAKALDRAAEVRSEGGVLVFGHPGPLKAALGEALAAEGRKMVHVEIGTDFEQVSEARFRVNPDAGNGIAPLGQAIEALGLDVRDVIYLWSAQPDCGLPDEECARAARACARLAASVSALKELRRPLAITVVSNAVENVTGAEEADIARGTVAALVRSITGEYNRTHARHLDCGDMTPAQTAQTIVAEMRTHSADLEIAYRAGRRWVPVLEPLTHARPTPHDTPLQHGGRYLVSGGLGGIGTALAAFLLREYDAQVLLVGRSPAPQGTLERLREISAKVEFIRADVADAPALRAAVEPVLSEWGKPLTAAFHLAAGYHESSLAEETERTLHELFLAKIGGANALLSLLRDHEGASLVAFSSILSMFGGALVGAYAASNRYLDALATRRGPTPVHSLDWSAWQDTGLNRRYGSFEPLRALGAVELTAELALASLQVALNQPPGQIVIGLDQSSANVARHTPSPVLACRIVVFHEGETEGHANRGLAPLRDRFGTPCGLSTRLISALPLDSNGVLDQVALRRMAEHGAALRAPTTPTQQGLWEIWRRVLGLEAIGVEESFFELGGQSLLAMQLLSAIATRFGVRWSLRDIFSAPTIASQASHIDAERARAPAGGQPATLEAVTASARGHATPLAPGQQRLWFLDQIHPGNCAYHISATLRFEEYPSAQVVRRCLQILVERHESLRTRFPRVDGEPRQWIDGAVHVAMRLDDLDGRASLDSLQNEEARTPFNLAQGPLFRARLLRLSAGRGALLLTLHHSIADGWSMKVLLREFLTLFQSEGEACLPPLTLQFADFAAWQQASARTGGFEPQVRYWRGQLEGNLLGFTLPTDFARPAVQTYSGARLVLPLPMALARRARGLARQRGVTLFVTLLAAFKAMLARYSQQDDIVVGTVFANRNRAELEPIVGFMVNLLAMRTDLGGDPRFADVLQRVQRVVIEGHAHAEVPFESLIDSLQPPRDTSRSPLFQIAFDVRDPDITRSALPAVTLGIMEPDLGASQYDLHLTFAEEGEGLTAVWYYNTDLFSPATIERMAANYNVLLEAAADQPEQRLSRLPILAEREHGQLLQWNRTEAAFARGSCLHQLFESQVDRVPEQAGVLYRGEITSYRELDTRANRLAHKLRTLGVGPDALVGVSLERSPDLVVAILAILKAGGAYLPLDPTYPPERLEYMLEDSGIELLLTRAAFASIFESGDGSGPTVVAMEEVDAAGYPATRPESGVGAHHLAYVIYTSGSTGRPKGVLVEHHGWCNVAQAQRDLFGLKPGMRVLQFASLSFDASAFELSMALAHGGTLVLGDSQDLMPGPGLARLLREAKVNVITVPPSSLAALSGEFPDLNVITVAGEACPTSIVDRWARPPLRFFNLYGPTETTIWASWAECHAGAGETPPIGKPVPNMQLHVLDARGKQLPVGMPGELYIGGEGVARGYRNRPELQLERFVPDPFSNREGARLYRSGDLVRRRNDGELEFLGRLDHQVKIRGFRIELGEVDAVLRTQACVQEAVVVARTQADGDSALVAYVSPRAGRTAPTVAELRQHMQAFLPAFMVPARIVVLDRLPVTANGKVDRAALPDPERLATPTSEVDLPQNEIERLVAGVWQQVLNLPAVDRRQSFFEAGGHSLKMAKVHALLSERLGRELSLVDLFRYPTVSSLAAHLAKSAPRTVSKGIQDSSVA